jgi:hypothetical protein
VSEHEATATTDHEEIRRWAEERGGQPARVRGTGPDTGVLRICFPGAGTDEDQLEPISWDEWFEKFDKERLALLHQDRTKAGRESRFFKLVSREQAGSRPGTDRR